MPRSASFSPAALALCLTALFAAALPAQESSDEELRFVEQMRSRGYPDLALEYLEKRMDRKKYADVLPLEIARTRLAAANAEADAGKRLDQFSVARTELEQFAAKNAKHPRIDEVRRMIGDITVSLARTQLTRALSTSEGDEGRHEEFVKARKFLADAARQLKAAAPKLDEMARAQAELQRGILLVEQARTYLDDKEEKARGDTFKEAITVLEKASVLFDAKQSERWIALAWAGRAHSLNDEPRDADKKFNEVQGSKDRDGVRLASYFAMLGAFEKGQTQMGKPTRTDVVKQITAAQDWQRIYGRGGPEAVGVQYLLAEQYYSLGELAAGAERKKFWDDARAHARGLEGSDNEFSGRAAEIKIRILREEKAFTRPVEGLITFEDNYMRALWEHQELNGKEGGQKFDTDEKKKKQQELIVKVLRQALVRAADEKKRLRPVPPADLANAYYLMTGYQLALKNQRGAIEAGLELARELPRSKQAPLTAIYTAEALARLIQQGGGNEDFDQMKDEREQLYRLSELMVRNWPADKAGTVGRFHLGQYLIKKPLDPGESKEAREKKLLELCGDAGIYQVGLERAREKKFTECVALMRRVKPDFQGYTVAQFQLALAALQIHEDDAQQKRLDPDHKVQTLDGKSYRDVAIEALEKIPDLGGDADAELAGFYLRAKVRLGFLYYSDQKYVQMEALGKKLAGVLDRFKDDQKLAAEEKTFRQQIDSMQLYGLYGKAETDYRAGKYDAVIARLDPVVNELKEGKYPDLKENPRLLAGLMGLALRGNLQSERIDRALAVLEVWKKLDADEKAVANILQQTVVSLRRQIDELKKAKDKEKLARTTESFNAFLNKLAAQPGQHGPESVRLFAQSYLAIGKNARAAELLAKLPEPRADGGDRDVAGWRVSQVLLVRAMRLAAVEKTDSKEREEALKKADELMDRIMTGPDKKPGWGQRDVNALKEQILLYVDLGYFGAAVNRANSLKEILLRKINESAAMREHYFEVYYYFVYSFYRYGLAQTDPAKKEDAVQKSAAYLKKLANSNRDLGGEESRLRFLSFLESDEAADMRRDPEVVKLIEDLRKQ